MIGKQEKGMRIMIGRAKVYVNMSEKKNSWSHKRKEHFVSELQGNQDILKLQRSLRVCIGI